MKYKEKHIHKKIAELAEKLKHGDNISKCTMLRAREGSYWKKVLFSTQKEQEEHDARKKLLKVNYTARFPHIVTIE